MREMIDCFVGRDVFFSNFYFGWHAIRHPPYPTAAVLSNPRTHLVWLKTDSEKLNQIYVIITDGNLNILNEIFLDMTDKCHSEYSQLVPFLQRNILVNRSSPICGENVHIDRARIERILPAFLACCHYRNIDVDVLNILCLQWTKQIYDNRPYVKEIFSNENSFPSF